VTTSTSSVSGTVGPEKSGLACLDPRMAIVAPQIHKCTLKDVRPTLKRRPHASCRTEHKPFAFWFLFDYHSLPAPFFNGFLSFELNDPVTLTAFLPEIMDSTVNHKQGRISFVTIVKVLHGVPHTECTEVGSRKKTTSRVASVSYAVVRYATLNITFTGECNKLAHLPRPGAFTTDNQLSVLEDALPSRFRVLPLGVL
jgi:hypothetical protein